eukprot:6848834-Pyramimonas_sp.AAC.1
MGDKAWGRVAALAKQFGCLALCETHIGYSSVMKWRKKAQESALKLHANRARPKSTWIIESADYANEGGKFFLAARHRPAHIMDEARAAQGLRSERGTSFDGSVPVLLELTVCSIVAVTFYGHSSAGRRDQNVP